MVKKDALSVGVVKETIENEARVAATPKTAKQMIKAGFKVLIETDAGINSYITNKEYEESGAIIVDSDQIHNCDILLSINPLIERVDLLKEGCCLISTNAPVFDKELLKKCLDKKLYVFSLSNMPRITRAQSMDVLSSQSNLAGYKAVIMAANESPKLFPLMMTAAGTIRPAKVIVLGAGVAGLQAVATAKRLGAIVEVSDVRPEVKEQVESLGASFIEVEFEEDVKDEQGYAKQSSEDYLKRQKEELIKRMKDADVVITTALVKGSKAPVLIDEKMVESMKKGAVIVDMAAVQGGNCSLTEQGKIVEKHGIKIIGPLNIPSEVSLDSSNMLASNIYSFLMLITKNGKLSIDEEDEIVASTIMTNFGAIRNDDLKELGDDK